MLFFLFLSFSYVACQALLGQYVGLEGVYNEEEEVGGYALSLYNLAYDPVPINQSSTILWEKKGEKFFDESISAINVGEGLAYFALTTEYEDYSNDFEVQRIYTWKYKDGKQYKEDAELLYSCDFTTEKDNQILKMWFSEKLNSLIAVTWDGNEDYSNFVFVDPQTCKIEYIIKSTEYAFGWLQFAGYSEELQMIIYQPDTEEINSTQLAFLDIEKKTITIKNFNEFYDYGSLSNVLCLIDKSQMCLAYYEKSQGPYTDPLYYVFEFPLYDHGKIKRIDEGKGYGLDGDIAWYQGKQVIFFMNFKYHLKLEVHLLYDKLNVLFTHNMIERRYPIREYLYDPQIKL